MAINPAFKTERQGKTVILYAGLLDEAHNQGLKAIRTRLVQIPEEANNNVAIVQAEVETEKGLFSGIGDAAIFNVTKMIVPHLIRMAETRAKARALRDAINIGDLCLDELGDDEDPAHPAKPHAHPAKNTATRPTTPANGHAPAELILGNPITNLDFDTMLAGLVTHKTIKAVTDRYNTVVATYALTPDQEADWKKACRERAETIEQEKVASHG